MAGRGSFDWCQVWGTQVYGQLHPLVQAQTVPPLSLEAAMPVWHETHPKQSSRHGSNINLASQKSSSVLPMKGKIHTLYPRALSSLAEQGYRSMNLYLSTSKAVSLPSYSSLKAVNRLRSTFRILAKSPMLLSKAKNRAQISLRGEIRTKFNILC